LRELFVQVGQRLKITQTVGIVYSAAVQVPTVIGWLRPMVLIPLSALVGLSTSQLQALLAHELAHVRRNDYLVNILQSVVETLLFYHPAVWWISKQIRKERENCCDDLAVAVSGDSLGYAKALSRLAEQSSSLPVVALGADGGVLTARIKRLLGGYDSPGFSRLAAITLLITASAVAGLAVSVVARAQSNPAGAAEKSSQDLPARYQRWLDEDVHWIVTPEERAAFLHLSDNEERDQFVKQFWLRRSPTPNTSENKFKEEHYRRLAYANTRFVESTPGWNTDRGRIYIVYGPPDEIEAHPRRGEVKAMELWRYYSGRIGGVADKKVVDMKFVDGCNCGNYRLESGPGN
jgi:GWxTD domain-containing protein